MAGISSKAAGKLENKIKYDGYEFNGDFDINLYESFYRSHDPQLGRFWQIDPKPNYGESPYTSMSNNPILYNDLLGDTVSYKNTQTQQMVDKFSKPTTVNKNGKEVRNRNYNEAFARVLARLDASVDNFVFNFDASAKEGSVSHDGSKVNVTVGNPGDSYGTRNEAEGVLFEETKHAEQVLDGKTMFGKKTDGTWGAATNLQNEIEAKMFAADQLGVVRTYTEKDKESGIELSIPTQLGYLKYTAKTETDKMLFLRNGASNLSVNGSNGRYGTANINAAYPTLDGGSINNTLTNRTKTDKIFGYPPR